jgi:hypothetical protein
MKPEQNGRPGGVQHPEEGSPVPKGETRDGHEVVVDTGGAHKGASGGADKLEGADALGEDGTDLGRGAD